MKKIWHFFDGTLSTPEKLKVNWTYFRINARKLVDSVILNSTIQSYSIKIYETTFLGNQIMETESLHSKICGYTYWMSWVGRFHNFSTVQSEHRTFLTAWLRASLSADASTHLQDTVISTLVAGMLPVIGSKSYTDDVSSSLSITSPSIRSIARARGGSGVIRELHSLAPAVRSESPVTPENRSETRRPPVRPGEAATSQMLKLERMERRAPSEGTPTKKGEKRKKQKRTWLTLCAA